MVRVDLCWYIKELNEIRHVLMYYNFESLFSLEFDRKMAFLYHWNRKIMTAYLYVQMYTVMPTHRIHHAKVSHHSTLKATYQQAPTFYEASKN